MGGVGGGLFCSQKPRLILPFFTKLPLLLLQLLVAQQFSLLTSSPGFQVRTEYDKHVISTITKPNKYKQLKRFITVIIQTLTITPQDQSPALSPPHSPDSYSNPTYEEAGEQFKGSLNLLYDSADGKVWEEKPGDANRLSSFKPVYDTADGKGSEKEQNGSLDPEGGTDRFTLVCGDKGASPYEVAILN